jgi:hypothetical protein
MKKGEGQRNGAVHGTVPGGRDRDRFASGIHGAPGQE